MTFSANASVCFGRTNRADGSNPAARAATRARRLVAAIVDRVTFNADIVETGTNSYRLRTSKARARAT